MREKKIKAIHEKWGTPIEQLEKESDSTIDMLYEMVVWGTN